MKFGRIILTVLTGLLLGLVMGCQTPYQPGIYTDDMGRTVNIGEMPERIVSHVPPITETLFALGLGDRVVGVSDYCDYPEEALEKPSVGDYYKPSVETIVAQDPDLVITDGHSDSISALDSLGIDYLVIDPKDIDGIFRDIELLGKVTGVEARADELIRDMETAISDVEERVTGASAVRVLYIIDATDMNNPWTAGPGSFVDSLISMAGGENIASQAPAPWAQFSIEAVLSTDPEIIIIPSSHGTAITPLDTFKEHPAWKEVTAVKQDAIYIIDGDLVDGYGPRIIQGLEEIARIIHPELF